MDTLIKETTLTQLNLGCGEYKLPGFLNVDKFEGANPDLLFNLGERKLPLADESMELVTCFHFIEHLEKKHWQNFFFSIWDVLKPRGKLVLGYPEFETCAKYYLENYLGQREFWRVALYGRQAYPGDYHVTPVVTSFLMQELTMYGFGDFKHQSEGLGQEYATVLRCRKQFQPTRENCYVESMFNVKLKAPEGVL